MRSNMPNEYESPIGQRPEITGVVIPPAPRHDPYAAFRSRGFRFFTTGNLLSILRACNHGLNAIAGVFEQHQQTFHFDDASIPLIYLLLFLGAIARTFSWAARSSFFPTLVPRDAFSNAVTWNNSIFQIGSVVG